MRLSEKFLIHELISINKVKMTILWTLFFFTAQANLSDPDFQRLAEHLAQLNIPLKWEKPPGTGNYGAFEPKSQTIWLDPIIIDLGIAKPTLIHESVHVAQECKGKGKLIPLNLDLETPALTRRYFMRYSGDRRDLEREAYTVQAQSNSTEIAIALLEKYCQNIR